MSQKTYRDAIREALREEMLRDERVLIMGEEVGVWLRVGGRRDRGPLAGGGGT